jgi:hypothetical protein
MNDAPAATLPPIPLVELGARPPAALVATQRDRAAALLAADEIAAVAEALGAPGAWFLNVNYEWACTGGVAPSPDGRGSRLLRVLDWRMEGLGANILAVRREGPAGSWVDLTWPGFVGCIQGLAPRRFAAALNQAPLRRRTGTKALDWAAMRGAVWRRRALPPAHLLRRAFDEARDYREARALLTETPLALPAIFLLSGARPGEGCAGLRARRAHRRRQPLDRGPRARPPARSGERNPAPFARRCPERSVRGLRPGGFRVARAADPQPHHAPRHGRRAGQRQADRPGLRARRAGDRRAAPGQRVRHAPKALSNTGLRP